MITATGTVQAPGGLGRGVAELLMEEFMRDEKNYETIPVGRLGLIPVDGCQPLAKLVDQYLVGWRKERLHDHKERLVFDGYERDSYIIDAAFPRFGSGEAKCQLSQSIRGDDLFILVDVCNSSLTYSMNGHINRMSPDDHFQNLKRVIAAASGHARRINVFMPFLYESRQHRKNGRESMDCAMALQELVSMGVNNIITFDAHDPKIQNAIPLHGFETVRPAYQFIKYLLKYEQNLTIDNDHMMVISPDEGGMNRAVYMANVLGLDVGMFYKRRDYSTIINGKNPIVAHEFLGDNIDGKDVIIIDDMISSGGSMIDTAKQLKSMNAKRVFICCTFGLFTDGLKAFDEAYEKCYFDKIVTTNLTYQPPELLERPYYVEADMSKFLASIIDFMNHDSSMANVSTPTDKIQELLAKYNNREEYTL